jgi:hypothetical protein
MESEKMDVNCKAAMYYEITIENCNATLASFDPIQLTFCRYAGATEVLIRHHIHGSSDATDNTNKDDQHLNISNSFQSFHSQYIQEVPPSTIIMSFKLKSHHLRQHSILKTFLPSISHPPIRTAKHNWNQTIL